MTVLTEKINVLLTAIGCPGGPSLIQGLREDSHIKIIGTDMRKDVVAKYLVGKFYAVPPGRNSSYIGKILEIVRREKIDVILPLATFELDALSRHKADFREEGCEVCVSDITGLTVANNRYLMSKRFEGKSFIPDFEIATDWEDMQRKMEKLGFPDRKVVIKPFVSHGSIGLKIVDDNLDLYAQYRNCKPYSISVNSQVLEQVFKGRTFDDILLQEYLPGREWEVDLLLNPVTHKMICGGLREESEVVLSAADKVIFTESPKEVLDIGKYMAEELKLSYTVNLSVKLAEDGTPKATEINPRSGTGMILPISAGLNFPLWSVYLAKNRGFNIPELKRGLRKYMYRGFLIVNNDGVVINRSWKKKEWVE